MARIDAGALRFRGIGAAACTRTPIDVVSTVPRYRLETIMTERHNANAVILATSIVSYAYAVSQHNVSGAILKALHTERRRQGPATRLAPSDRGSEVSLVERVL
jgi:hypothetical protein